MPNVVNRGSSVAVGMTYLGIFLGLVCFAASVQAEPAVEQRFFSAVGMPPPDLIPASGPAVCGGLVTTVNTALFIWQKLSERPKRRKRKVKSDEATGS
jgi:hypothetical protein